MTHKRQAEPNPTNPTTPGDHHPSQVLHTRTYVPNLHPSPHPLSTQHMTSPANNIPPETPSCTVIQNSKASNWPKKTTKVVSTYSTCI
ncbi:hypothetical protein BDQ94DRAFT_147054 [Aspergillus welwitschiae]|uniref:Uncharacterized protein n=1 Tax=Aspergillus welwitschiae TaxID=1341132 RepID=A0A3F3PXW1_9EURO|nr:hypothetical protein BDQ94DRAFT_147054 [Aspergillus welwitschiae]RDH31602.1 hypothetical protein BDQ94DRAFT_147054 [Aspergillus welwitschiae]